MAKVVRFQKKKIQASGGTRHDFSAVWPWLLLLAAAAILTVMDAAIPG